MAMSGARDTYGSMLPSSQSGALFGDGRASGAMRRGSWRAKPLSWRRSWRSWPRRRQRCRHACSPSPLWGDWQVSVTTPSSLPLKVPSAETVDTMHCVPKKYFQEQGILLCKRFKLVSHRCAIGRELDSRPVVGSRKLGGYPFRLRRWSAAQAEVKDFKAKGNDLADQAASAKLRLEETHQVTAFTLAAVNSLSRQ
eukprot:1177362-Prorocentrum_minimum.AAC.4